VQIDEIFTCLHIVVVSSERRYVMVIDVHGHLGNINQAPFWEASFEKLEVYCTRAGVDWLCVSSAKSLMYDVREGNRDLYHALKKTEKLLGYVTVNPVFPESRYDLKLLVENKKFKGVKIHPDYHGYDLKSRQAREFMEEVLKNGVDLVLTHVSCMPGTGFADVETVAHFAAEHPQTNFILAHLGGIYQNNLYPYFPNTRGLEIIGQIKADNIFVDTAHYLMYVYPGVMEKMVELIGVNHIVYGTDCPLQGPQQMRFAKEVINNLDIGQSEKDLILGGTASKLLHLDGGRL